MEGAGEEYCHCDDDDDDDDQGKGRLMSSDEESMSLRWELMSFLVALLGFEF